MHDQINSRKRALRLLAVAFTCAAMTGLSEPQATAEQLLGDDFNDNSFDTAKWDRDTSIPQGGASVVEQNQRMELTARGHLLTADEFDPEALGGLRVRGEWTFANISGLDFMQILTRSDGQPAGGFGETANGIEFRVNTGGNQTPGISTRGGSLSVGDTSSQDSVDIQEGDTFDVDIVDAGGALYLGLTDQNDAGNTASATARVSQDTFDQDHVVFHNRENNGRQANLDNVTIDRLPEPGPTEPLSDDFNDNSFDPTVWTRNNDIPQGGASVREQNGRMELTQRGHLSTVRQITPDDGRVGGIEVSGEWTFDSLGNRDFMQILTRSDGLPGGSFGETQNGVEFFMDTNGSAPTIRNRGGDLSVTDVNATGSLSISEGDTFDFRILDAGTNLFFRLTDASDPSNTAFVTGRIASDSFDSDRVTFHNRESGGRVAFLDNASIQPLFHRELADDFNDNSLDPSKWTTNTSIPQGGADVSEQNGRVELTNRGHLVSFREFDPTASAQSLVVSGEWTFAQPGSMDFFQVLTRTDGQPAGSFGETANGIEFFMATNGSTPTIRTRGSDLSVTDVTTNGSLSIEPGDVFDFLIRDAGEELSFSLTEVGNPSNSASVSALVSMDDFDQDFVAFHNRELAGGQTHIAYLDDVRVGMVPEPASALLLLPGAMLMARPRRRRRS